MFILYLVNACWGVVYKISNVAAKYLYMLLFFTGLQLDKESQETLHKLLVKITALSTDFTINVNEENTVLHFTKEELGKYLLVLIHRM